MEQKNANKQTTLDENEKKCCPQGTIFQSIGKAKPAPVCFKWEEEEDEEEEEEEEILVEEKTGKPLALDCMIEKNVEKLNLHHIHDVGIKMRYDPVYCKAREILAKYPQATALSNTFLLTSDFGEMDMNSKWSSTSRPLPKSEPVDSSVFDYLEKCLGDPDENVSILSPRFKYPDPTAIPSLEEFVSELINEARTSMQNGALNDQVDRSSAKG